MQFEPFIRYASGNQLVINATGMAPKLFLEWVRDTAPAKGFAIDVQTKYLNADSKGHSLSDEWNEDYTEVFCIRMPAATKELFHSAKDYIAKNI